jgi:hypothetical protein
MLFLWTKSEKLGSKLITWGCGGPSHFAIAFDESENGYGLVLHSHYHGVSLTWFHDFYMKNEVVYALAPKDKFSLDKEESIYRAIISNTFGSPYDSGAMLYFAWRVLLKRVVGSEIPKANPWGTSRSYLCVELYDWLTKSDSRLFPPLLKSSAIASPQEVYDAMKTSTLLAEVPWIRKKQSALKK